MAVIKLRTYADFRENRVKTESLGLINLLYLGMHSLSTHILAIVWKPYCPKVPLADH